MYCKGNKNLFYSSSVIKLFEDSTFAETETAYSSHLLMPDLTICPESSKSD